MAAAELRGERLLNLNDCELAVDFIVFGQSLRRGKKEVMETFIPVKYMEAEKLRYQFYRKIALAGDEKILSDISAELDDRFGQIPKEVQNLLEFQRLKIITLKAGYNRLRVTGEKLEIHDTRRNSYLLVNGYQPKLSALSPSGKLHEIMRIMGGKK
jgi:transcription-repair coupling factor (superfamily II helicase)